MTWIKVSFSAPPGVGKTIFARALAKECNATLVATSLAQWQACGHLGDLLRAMRADFAKAKALAPAILFIDEMDSVGDRANFDRENANYSTQVVNALLEALDGLGDREGVVVVAATNDVSRIDPALLRSGRLDQHVSIPLPNRDDRLQILRQLSGLRLEGRSAWELALKTNGMTGADIAKSVRDARRIARRSCRRLQPKDIMSALPEVLTLDAEHLRAVAIHETGHTLVGLVLKWGEYLGTEVFREHLLHPSVVSCGTAQFGLPPLMRRERQAYLDHIAVCLAGIAAEQIWLGNYGDGGQVDLVMATRLATLMETSLGFGPTLRASEAPNDEHLEQLRRNDPDLRQRIDRTLAEQFKRSKELLNDQTDLANALIKELLVVGRLSPDRFVELSQGLHDQPYETETLPR